MSKRLLDALNDQFNYELESTNIYLAMAGVILQILALAALLIGL